MDVTSHLIWIALERVRRATLAAYGPPKLVAEGQELPFIIVSPQVPARATWDIDALDALLGEVLQKNAVDEDRV